MLKNIIILIVSLLCFCFAIKKIDSMKQVSGENPGSLVTKEEVQKKCSAESSDITNDNQIYYWVS